MNAKAKETKTGEKGLGSNKVDAKGRVSIPAEAREEFSLDPGTLLLFVKTRDGELVVRKL